MLTLCVVEILSVLSLCVKSLQIDQFRISVMALLLLVALGFESWPDSRLALARGSGL